MAWVMCQSSICELHQHTWSTSRCQRPQLYGEGSAVVGGPLPSFQKSALQHLAAQEWQSSGNPQGQIAVSEAIWPALVVILTGDGKVGSSAPIYSERRTMTVVEPEHAMYIRHVDLGDDGRRATAVARREW